MTATLTPPDGFAWKRTSDAGQVETILAAAEGCFSRAGYAAASMREIAEHAGVSKSLLHYHFQSKEHLFVEVQIRAYERLAARVTLAVSQVASGSERGLLAFDAAFDALRANGALAKQAELWAGALSNEKLRVHVVRLREFFRALLVSSIEQVLGPDRERLPMSVEAAADLVWATLNGLGIASAFGEPEARVERAIAALRALAGIALGQPAPLTPHSSLRAPQGA